jgi:hypothetical protein
MAGRFARQTEAARGVVSRATTIPFLVRVAVAASGAAAMAVAWPTAITATEYFVFLVLLGIYPAVAPRGHGATVSALTVVAGWLVSTVGFDTRVALWRVLTLAMLLYIGHSLTALAAVLPSDAVVNLDVIGGWLVRAALVVLLSAVLTVVTLALSADLAGGAFLVATLVGIAGAVGATLLIARLLQRA